MEEHLNCVLIFGTPHPNNVTLFEKFESIQNFLKWVQSCANHELSKQRMFARVAKRVRARDIISMNRSLVGIPS